MITREVEEKTREVEEKTREVEEKTREVEVSDIIYLTIIRRHTLILCR